MNVINLPCDMLLLISEYLENEQCIECGKNCDLNLLLNALTVINNENISDFVSKISNKRPLIIHKIFEFDTKCQKLFKSRTVCLKKLKIDFNKISYLDSHLAVQLNCKKVNEFRGSIRGNSMDFLSGFKDSASLHFDNEFECFFYQDLFNKLKRNTINYHLCCSNKGFMIHF